MGRQSKSLTLVVLGWFLMCGALRAQPAPMHHNKPEFRSTRERWNTMSPDDRQIFRRNAERWMQMGPDERNLMRQREQIRREQLKREAAAAMRDAGLRLDQEKSQLFEQRYLQERRRIERELRDEAEAKRKQELPVLKDRLKKEFQEPSSPAGTSTSPATPAVSVTPKH